ncbi:uncharacterized protein LOC118742870 [Rhagoletis pomonella]|uniref:uncharacterized protein LOC118742870 n=1 Tax=Rhagoletis pomonella TaxID=28610 RepID=UPI00177C4C92|nr:uncharacterized protein LOC118742870 [Rhagoletis pomonella]
MMTKSVIYFHWLLMLGIAVAAPSKLSERQSMSHSQAATVTVTPKYPIEDMQLMQPHYITLEDFESLLRRAGELFRPNAYVSDESKSMAAQQKSQLQPLVAASEVATPYRQIQPPSVQPFNFYMPLFDYDHGKLDTKSKRLEHIVPPPAPGKGGDQTNYYAAKPKKLPKKFNAGTKQVNVKWLNAFEKEALNDASGRLPKAVYLLHDERNRINFDDSFFGVDMQVKIPNNQPHKEEHVESNGTQAQEEFLNQGEEGGEEDLLASAAGQVAHRVSKV